MYIYIYIYIYIYLYIYISGWVCLSTPLFRIRKQAKSLSKIESGTLTDESIRKFLNKARNPKVIELNQKLQNLKSFMTVNAAMVIIMPVYGCLYNYLHHL